MTNSIDDGGLYESCKEDVLANKYSSMIKCISDAATMMYGNQVRSINMLFIIYAASLVFFMQAGFAMICAGCVRKINVQNTMLKNLIDACGSAIAFYVCGYAFAYGGDSDSISFIGSNHFFLSDMGGDDSGKYSHWLFQFAFAASSGTIVAGTMAERCRMGAYIMYSIFLIGFVYPVIARAVWSESGFLSMWAKDPLLGIGMVDFAGGGVVHVTGGMTAVVAARCLGPRRGRFFDEEGVKLETPKPFPGHSKSLQMLGTFILWFGWYGFNAGSAINSNIGLKLSVIGLTVVNTTLAASTGGIVALGTNIIWDERRYGESKYNLSSAMNGCISGLVAITAGCAIVEPWAAVVIGVVSAWVYLWLSELLLHFCIDDAVNAIPVHLGNGIWGILSVGLFATKSGLKDLLGSDEDPSHFGWFYEWGEGSGDGSLLACQVVGLLFIIGWVTFLMGPFFFILNYSGKLRADGLEEAVGLDISYSHHLINPNEEVYRSYHEKKTAHLHESKSSTQEKFTDDGEEYEVDMENDEDSINDSNEEYDHTGVDRFG